MGVKGLWSLLEPAARPVRLEALAHTRLAVDASIWLYQLLNAMKDADGNPVEDAHILGFYRRICKLLYYGIWPVFVFDGGAPELKRATIAERQAARGQRTNDARRTAHQLLQAQLKLHALGTVAEQTGADPSPAAAACDESPLRKRKRDEYELPPMQRPALAMRAENAHDLRMAHPEDLHQLLALAAQRPDSTGDFDGLEIDTESAAFKALSPEDQHDLIVALKVRSRQTSHDRLQRMLQSSDSAMDFSKQQIELLVKRNTLTQQWLQVTGNDHRVAALPASAGSVTMGRVAGERNRAYMLSRSDQPGGGWTLNAGGDAAAPAVADFRQEILVESSGTDGSGSAPGSDAELRAGADADSDSDSVEWEDVPPECEQLYGMKAGAAGGDRADSDAVQVSSEEEGDDDDACIASGDDLDSDSAFMDLYAESEALGLISPEEQERLQQRLRMKREKEENAILQLPAEEFLGMWARLVTQPMVAAEPRIYDDMRNWLVCEPLDALWECAWRANRRYEKLPDVQTSASDDDDDDDSDSDSAGVGQARRSASAASACSDLTELQSKVTRLALIANYLTFAWRWRKLREPAPGSVPGSVPEAGAADAQSDVISISTEGETSGSASPHNDGAAQAVSPRNGHEMGLSEAESPTRRHRDAIFEKARALAGPEPRSSDSAAPAGRQAAVVNAIDNGSEGCTPSELSLDDSGDEKDDVDTAMADGNDGNDEQESDNDLDTPTSKHAQLLRDEQDEYALFVGKLKEAASDTPAERSGTYRAARVELERELQELRVRLRDSQRNAAGVERDMVEDIRMLLTLFGIPYITAPLEAEAQCAALVAQQLVDGMVTDDSDAFLFASTSRTRVYRHFFQKDRYVEMYSGEGIYQDSSLARRDLVFLACLLGSDYTVGIKGIGPVLAMEALAEFGPSTTGDADAGDASDDEARVASALRRFRAWCDLVAGVLPGLAVPDDIAGTPRRRRLAQVVRKAGVPPGFPSLPAVHAYFCPQVDPSEAKLEWGFPRLDMLRQFMSDRLGWPADKTDETLVPVARKMAEAGGPGGGLAQPTLDAFVRPAAPPPGAGLPAAGVGHSKRVGAAISLHKRRQAGGAMQN